MLTSRLVTIGRLIEPSSFEASVRRQLAEMGVAGEPRFLPSPSPKHADGPSRRVLRIKDRRIVGYPLVISGLTAAESLIVQEKGVGEPWRRMGCGVFVRIGGGFADGQ